MTTLEEVVDIVENEGLGYAISCYLDADEIKIEAILYDVDSYNYT